MFAVFKTGGKQYRVAANDLLKVEKVDGVAGDIVEFTEVLMVGEGASASIGAPTVAGAVVTAAVVEQGRAAKVIAFKKRRRQNSKRKRGHRQDLTLVRITEILTGGAKAAPAKKAAAPVAASAGAVSDDVELIAGIGPTIGKKLKAAGVTTWRQVAEWTDADIAKYDAEFNLRGRIQREEWVEQSKELMAGKPPRAKIDQERAAKDGE